jgi:hypothetical protein
MKAEGVAGVEITLNESRQTSTRRVTLVILRRAVSTVVEVEDTAVVNQPVMTLAAICHQNN